MDSQEILIFLVDAGQLDILDHFGFDGFVFGQFPWIQIKDLEAELHGEDGYLTSFKKDGDFPSSPVVKTLSFRYRGCGLNPWSGK